MFNKLKRPYKEVSCEETLRKIKNILSEIDLKIVEIQKEYSCKGIYWSSVVLDSSEGEFNTNGKGRTPLFALTSAYAEFLERIQNGLNYNFPEIILQDLKKEQNFIYFPDEVYIDKNEFLNLDALIRNDIITYKKEKDKQEYIDLLFKRLEEKNQKGMLSVPFYDTKNDKILHIPYNHLLLAVGSNGMAAGNTQYEAIFQGLYEIIERWNASKVYYQQLTPPSVPDDFLKQFSEEYEIIQQIKIKSGCEVIVKDFSVDKQFTSLGLLIIDEKNKKYRLNVGAESSFQVMLSRCLTEIHQGMNNIDMFKSFMLDIPINGLDYFKKDDDKSLEKRNQEFSQFIIDGRGIYPKSLFKEKPDYEFDPDIFKSYTSYKEETLHLIKKFHDSGYNVYIRNVSFLGFPSYFIYIPYLSSVGKKIAKVQSNIFNQIEIDKIINDLFHFNECTEEKLTQIAILLETIDKSIKVKAIFSLEFDHDSTWEQMTLSFFLTLLWYRLQNMKKAIYNFEYFLKTENDVEDYYNAILIYFNFRNLIDNEEQAKKILKENGIDENTAIEVFNDLKDPEKVFQYINFPNCPDCRNCKLINECKTYRKVKAQKKINSHIGTQSCDSFKM